MKLQVVGVVGAGVIGRGVAQALAQTGHRVVLVDSERAALDSAARGLQDSLRFAAMTNASLREVDHSEIVSRVTLTTDYRDLGEADFVIENVTEDQNLKEAVYRQLDAVCRPDCVFAVNTSAVLIDRLAGVTGRPEQLIGMHFMNPVPQKHSVEVIVGPRTSTRTLETAVVLLDQLGKKAIVVKDSPGFVSNRVMMLMINEAISVVEDGVADPAQVDAIFVQCFAHKMGPLATADLIGLDTILRTLDVLRDSLGDAKFEASRLLRDMVGRGQWGRKSGSGFFEYEAWKRTHSGK